MTSSARRLCRHRLVLPAMPTLCCLIALAWLTPNTWAASPAKAEAAPTKSQPAPQADKATSAKGSAVTAPATAVATAAPVPDPMEQLRQRLADRLAGGRAAPRAASDDGPVEVRIPPPRQAAAPATGRGEPTARANRPGGAGPLVVAAAAQAAGHGPAAGKGGKPEHWSYDGPAGPQTWGGLRPDFMLCGKGQRQSPVDIRGGLEVELEPVRFEYQSSPFGVIDNGHTIQANVAPGNRIEVGGKRFELVQFHFHRPSEERIDGRQFEMSLHLVHKDEKGRLAVVALLLDKGPALPAVQQVWNNLPLEKKEEARARTPLDLGTLVPTDKRYYTYMGSLTTPPCTEGVQWIVMRQPVTVSAEQIELFARIYPMNARPVQQLAGRRILQSP
jgi:carbonic anhydrase